MSDPRFIPESDDIGGLMAKLSEELGEAQAALGKAMRWGCESVNPDLPESEQVRNITWLAGEIHDVNKAWKAFYDAISMMSVDEIKAAEPRFQDRRRTAQ